MDIRSEAWLNLLRNTKKKTACSVAIHNSESCAKRPLRFADPSACKPLIWYTLMSLHFPWFPVPPAMPIAHAYAHVHSYAQQVPCLPIRWTDDVLYPNISVECFVAGPFVSGLRTFNVPDLLSPDFSYSVPFGPDLLSPDLLSPDLLSPDLLSADLFCPELSSRTFCMYRSPLQSFFFV